MWAALNFDERPELVHFEPGFFLGLVIELIGHVSEVVADPATHRNRDMLALTPIVAIVAPTGSAGNEQTECEAE